MTPLGEGSWKLASGFLQTFTDASVFGDFALYISMVIHHSFEYRYVLIRISPPIESWYPGVTWGPQHSCHKMSLTKISSFFPLL